VDLNTQTLPTVELTAEIVRGNESLYTVSSQKTGVDVYAALSQWTRGGWANIGSSSDPQHAARVGAVEKLVPAIMAELQRAVMQDEIAKAEAAEQAAQARQAQQAEERRVSEHRAAERREKQARVASSKPRRTVVAQTAKPHRAVVAQATKPKAHPAVQSARAAKPKPSGFSYRIVLGLNRSRNIRTMARLEQGQTIAVVENGRRIGELTVNYFDQTGREAYVLGDVQIASQSGANFAPLPN
jgi:hypothetical protein